MLAFVHGGAGRHTRPRRGWCGMVRYGAMWNGAVRCGTVWHGAAWCGTVRQGAAWRDMVRHGAARCGMVRRGAARCGMARAHRDGALPCPGRAGIPLPAGAPVLLAERPEYASAQVEGHQAGRRLQQQGRLPAEQGLGVRGLGLGCRV